MELQPSYYAVIPANVRYDKTLSPLARLMYAEITALSNQYGYCFATNKYFAELYEVTDRTVRNWIESLIEKGYISRSYVVVGNKKRRILSINPHAVTVPGNPLEVIEKLEEEELESQGGKKFPQGRKIISENAENNFRHNNTSNINNNIYNARARAIPQKRAPDKGLNAKNNKFMNFDQRDDIDYQLLEEKLLNKSSP